MGKTSPWGTSLSPRVTLDFSPPVAGMARGFHRILPDCKDCERRPFLPGKEGEVPRACVKVA